MEPAENAECSEAAFELIDPTIPIVGDQFEHKFSLITWFVDLMAVFIFGAYTYWIVFMSSTSFKVTP